VLAAHHENRQRQQIAAQRDELKAHSDA
jgi:hypothetical protein